MESKNSVFYLNCEDEDNWVLRLPREVSDRDWRLYFGSQQNKIFNSKNVTFSSLTLDFSNCFFADPTPLISILIGASDILVKGKNVSILLPDRASKKFGKKKQSFLKFLAREGFLDLITVRLVGLIDQYSLDANIECYEGEKLITEDSVTELSELDTGLNYERSYCLPVQLIDFKVLGDNSFDTDERTQQLNYCDDLTERFLREKIEKVVSNEVPGRYQTSLLYKLKVVIRESLHNIVEHAYVNDDKTIAFAMIYVRYRVGLVGASQNEIRYVDFGIKREGQADGKAVPKLNNDLVKQNSGFFEIFIGDGGQGICASDPEHANGHLNGALYKIFFQGHSRKKIRPTEFGGLRLLSQLSAGTSDDFIRVCDRDWWGASIPLRESGDDAQAIGRSTKNNVAVRGCYITFRYSWRHENKVVEHLNWPKYEKKPDDESIYAQTREYRGFRVYTQDQRIDGKLFLGGDRSPDKQGNAIFLPPAWLMKNEIQKRILSFMLESKAATIFVGDINTIEGMAYVYAIENSKLIARENLHTERIFLVTSDLRYLEFTKKSSGNFVRLHNPSHQFIKAYLEELRQVDSQRVWTNIQDENKYLPTLESSKVRWSSARFINGYIDFSYASSDQIAKYFIKKAVRRYVSYCGYEGKKIVSIDSVMQSFAEELNREYRESYIGSGSGELMLGSIQVTGTSLKRILLESSTPIVYCFAHPDGKGGQEFLFSWMQDKLGDIQPFSGYRRIGVTPFIAKNGWKYYKLPRYDQKYKSIYAQNPGDLYSTIQDYTRPVAKLGHWIYGNHHDLLTLNILSEFDSENDEIGFFANSYLANYLLMNLFQIFKINSNKVLSTTGISIRKSIASSPSLHGYKFKHKKNRIPIVVYPSHQVTDSIIAFFLSLIEDIDVSRDIKSRIFPFKPTKEFRQGSSFQIPGLIYERFTSVVEEIQGRAEKPKVCAVIFDDAAISSRTNLEIESILSGVGITEIYSLILFDRQRLPSAKKIESKQMYAYARFDVPTMGSSKHCPLCAALKLSEELSPNYLDLELKKRIQAWAYEWGERNTITEWGGHGLKAIPVNLRKPIKKYGYDFLSDEVIEHSGLNNEKTIAIKNSVGLITWISELQAMTGRDDLAVTIIDKENLSTEVKVQILVGQLLLFENEHDNMMLKELSRRLIDCVFELGVDNQHSSIAVLALLNIERKILFVSLSEWLAQNNSIEFFSLSKDLRILFSYAVINGFDYKHHGKSSDIVKLILKPKRSLEKLWRFHYEVTDARGIRHLSPLNTVANSMESYDHAHTFSQYCLSLSFLHDLLLSDELKSHCPDIGLYALAAENGLSLMSYIFDLQRQLENCTGENRRKRLQELKHNTEDLLNELSSIHNNIFFPIGSQPLNAKEWLPEPTQWIEREWSKGSNGLFATTYQILKNDLKYDPLIEFKASKAIDLLHLREHKKRVGFDEMYTIFSTRVIRILKDIFSNVRYSATKGEDLTGLSNEIELSKVHAIIETRINFKEGFFEILARNSADRKKFELSQEEQLKLDRTFGHVKYIGGDFKLISGLDFEFAMLVRLPLAHFLEGSLND